MEHNESGIPAYSRPITVDVIIRHEEGIVLVKRGHPPFEGFWALPGGFVERDETVEEAAIREVAEETGLQVRLDRLVGVYSQPGRDPKRHAVAICYTAHVIGGTLQSGDDAADARVVKGVAESRLAFDHGEMCADAGVLDATGFGDHD